jgi:hypothetical protein
LTLIWTDYHQIIIVQQLVVYKTNYVKKYKNKNMATLTGQYISQSYGGIIQLSTNTGIVTGSFTQLQDGVGTNLGWSVKTGGILSGSQVTASLFGTTNTFVGIQTISGSVSNVVRALSITSQTASVDLSTGNLFTLTLVSGSTTNINPTNIQRGQTSMIQITQPAVGSGTVTFNSIVKFPSGSSYIASTGSNAIDTIALVSFNGTTLQSVSSYNFV